MQLPQALMQILPLCYLHWLLHPATILVPKVVLTLCYLR